MLRVVQRREVRERVADRVRHLGFVSDRDLATLYAQSFICVTAAIDEGFNLLPLEAMANFIRCDPVLRSARALLQQRRTLVLRAAYATFSGATHLGEAAANEAIDRCEGLLVAVTGVEPVT